MQFATDDLKIVELKELIAPQDLIDKTPITEQASECVHHSRKAVCDIIHNRDDRLVVIIGPCSVHNPDSAIEYATKLKPLIEKHIDNLHIVMRVYFEKPRTTVGWKGLINDPDLDDSFHINKGLHSARKLLLDLNQMGVSAGTEYLDLVSPQYISDLISWGAIGARTTESQSHRELASGLSCPVGFKNGTGGNTQIAIDALQSSSQPHHFLSVTKQGRSAIFSTKGNPDCHIIMRGGSETNYDEKSITAVAQKLTASHQDPRIMIDCSHANSQKDFKNQPLVGEAIAQQLRKGSSYILGVMIESNLVEGRQDLKPGKELVYGQSITDACIGWEATEALLQTFSDAAATARSARKA